MFLLLSVLVNLALGTYVLWHSPRRLQNRVFSLFIFNLVLWSFVNFLIAISDSITLVAVLGKFAYAVGSMIPATFATFVYVFPKLNKNISKKPLYIIYSVCSVLLILSFTSFVQKGVTITEEGFRPVLGPLHPLFSAYEVTGMYYGLWLLYRKWRLSANKYEQLQIKFTFLGILISSVIALVSNALLPLLGISELVSIGPTLTVVIIGFTAYTIVRYRLFDITLAIKKTALYTLLTASLTVSYLVCIFLVEKVLKGIVKYQTFFPALLSAIFIAFIFLPLREKIQGLVDKIFYKKKYNYQAILKSTGEKLTKVVSLPKLLRFLLESITNCMGIKKASIWLSEGNSLVMESNIGVGTPSDEVKISKNNSLGRWLRDNKDVLIQEELDRMKPTKELTSIKDFLQKMEAEIAVPIVKEDELEGVIFLGEKFMGDIFNQNDIDLLLAIANQAAVAIENARLFTKVEEAKVYQENILKNLASGVIVTGREGKIHIFNEKAEEITGLSVLKVVGKNYKNVMPDVLSRFIIDAEKFKKIYSSHEIQYTRNRNHTIPLGIGTAIMKDKHGKVNGVILVLADLTEIKTLEQHLYRAEKLATVGTLAAGMAHEIKNPLVAINTFLQLLPEKYEDPEFRREFSQLAGEEVKRINDLIHRLLNFAQPKPLYFSLGHIHSCIDDSLKFLSRKMDNHNITIVKRYSPKVPESLIDKTRLDEIFLNLFLNSIEAMNKGGTLYITTSYHPENNFKGDEKGSNNGSIQINIRDTGEGIPPESLSRIFDPFYSTKENGTGLGLAIVYRAINDHGGKIEVKSRTGKGTNFLISLPVFFEKPEDTLNTKH